MAMRNILSDGPGLPARPSWVRWRPRLLLAGCALLLSVIVLWQTSYWVRQFAVADMRERKTHTLNLVVENLRATLSKFQYQPGLLAKNPRFRAALSPDASRTEIEFTNMELERINFVSGALDTFLVNRDGVVVADSNWAAISSRLEKNVGVAPYFSAALQGRLGRYFGTYEVAATEEVSYYFAYPVRERDRIIGAIVVKLRVGRLAERWLSPDHETLVVDEHGVIFMSSRSAWRFRSLQPLTQAVRRRLHQLQKYGDRSLETLPVTWNGTGTQPKYMTFKQGGRNDGQDPHDSTYMVLHADMNAAGWRVYILARLDEIKNRQTIALAVASFMLISLILLAAFAHQRRLRQRERIALQEAARASLETEVKERTRDLTDANAQLRKEISDRLHAETELTKTRDELVQATKLAALGKMSAGLSHELNQPLTAIRSYSDNARTFLERSDTAAVGSNLTSISELTDRMARIIRNLRIYARNEPIDTRPTSVTGALDEALALLDERLNTAGIVVSTELPDREIVAIGGEVRLQQVFVNILSNAIDAMSEIAEKRLFINAEEHAETVTVSFHDTGSGLPTAGADDIFDPFYSTKEVGEGMGLGLSISYGIINQFGGRIDASNHPDGGAVFTIVLKRSHEILEPAE
jgi:two-component system C4-dicarboxylate transport sensor histidine kinase DctB